MNFAGLIFLLFAHYFTGRGIIKLFKVELSPAALFSFSFIVGVCIHSFVPCIMDLIHVPLTATNIYIWLTGTTLLASVPLFLRIRDTKWTKPTLPQLYEIPFIAVFLFLAFQSVWRCFYFPPTPRDVLTGVELIADCAVREHTMINSAFSVDVRLNGAANNIFKSPFITSLQLIYKLLVHPFGQEWLSVIFLSFTFWFYTLIRSMVHPLLAGMLVLILFAVPDLFAYTYIILYDYSNMVFFFCGYWFVMRFLDNQRRNDLLFASFLFGLATYIRSETLVLSGMVMLLIAWYQFRAKIAWKQIGIQSAIFLAGPIIFNIILSKVFIAHLVPYKFELGGLLNQNMSDISLFFSKMQELATVLIFSEKGKAVYADFYYFFFTVLIADLVFVRKLSKQAALALWGVFIVYTALAFLSYAVPSHTVINSAKRGLFKLLPLMVYYMASSGILQKLSAYLTEREERAMQKKTSPAPAAAKPNQTGKKK